MKQKRRTIMTRVSLALTAVVATLYSYTPVLAAKNSLGDAKDLGLPTRPANEAMITSIFNAALLVAGAVAVIMIVYGGILYATSSGDAGKIKTAKNLIIYTLVGVVIISFAFAIVRFVIGRFV